MDVLDQEYMNKQAKENHGALLKNSPLGLI
jgi:hypothetical protein